MLPGTTCGKAQGEDIVSLSTRRAALCFLFFDEATYKAGIPRVVLAVVVAPMLHMSGSRCDAVVHEFFK